MAKDAFQVEEFMVERWMNTYENDAIYNLAETDAKPLTLHELLTMGAPNQYLDGLLGLKVSYNPTLGSDHLRGLIAAQYQGVSSEDILVTSGAIEANFLLANVLIQPGDTVIVQSPAYQALYSVAQARGAQVKHWVMQIKDQYQPDMDALAALIDNRTKAVIINVPHNPTGAVISPENLRTILAWAEEKNFWVICDEVYHDMAIEANVLPPHARSISQRAISVGSLSKSFGLSGLRIGWIAATPHLVEMCWKWKDYTSISVSSISDYLACIALKEKNQIMARNIPLARANRDKLHQWLSDHREHMEWVPSRVGLLNFPKFTDLPISTEALCLGIFKEKKVLLMPGEAFQHPGHLRIGYGNDAQVFNHGLEIIDEYLVRIFSKGGIP